MNEWTIVSGALILMLAVIGFIFKWGWNIIQDVKKGFHSRIDKCDHAIDEIVKECGRKKDTYVTTSALDRFERHLNVVFEGFKSDVNHINSDIKHMTTRLDDFITNFNRNGRGK